MILYICGKREIQERKKQFWRNCDFSINITSKVLTKRSTLFAGVCDHGLLPMGQCVYIACCPEFIPCKSKNNLKRWWCLSSTSRSWKPIAKYTPEDFSVPPRIPSYDVKLGMPTAPNWSCHQVPFLDLVCKKTNFISTKFLKTSHFTESSTQWRKNLFSTPERFWSLRFWCLKLSTAQS